MENTTPGHTPYTRIMLFILAVVLLAASIVGYVISQKMSTSGGVSSTNHSSTSLRASVQATPTPTLIPYPVKGSLTMQVTGNKTYAVGTPITFDIVATSSKDTVAGYDVVVSYDTDAFDNQLIQNKINSFKIFTYKRARHISVSATKDLSVSEELRMNNIPVLSLSFLPKKKGTYVFSLKPVGNESSKFVNETAAVTYPETTDISLEIK